jgi:hypothetical protein
MLEKPQVKYDWDNVLPLSDFDLVIIKGDSGTGMSFLAKKLVKYGYSVFYETLLFAGSTESPAIYRDLKGLIESGSKVVYIGNAHHTKPDLVELFAKAPNRVIVSFALHPDIKIPVKNYIILSNV